jgi:cytochrome c peroxidase
MLEKCVRATGIPLLFLVAVGLCCANESDSYKWNLPKGFTVPPVPADNPMTTAKVELGRHLFYDRRMSGNGTQACASCHMQKFAFTDGKPRAVGSTGEVHQRGSMSLVNIAWAPTLTWGNPNLHLLEDQAREPMFGTHPVELGLDANGATFLDVVRGDKRYQKLFRRAYPEDADPFTIENVIRALASFERSIISARSAWDIDWRQVKRLSRFDMDICMMSEAAQRGEVLFFSDKLACARCHGGNNFNATSSGGYVFQTGPAFHNNGLAPSQPGLFEFTGIPVDTGKFKAPTLRNIELTAPYMHDGSIPTLEGVIDHYASGGSHAANQSPLVQGFELSQSDRADLVEFLRSLTDKAVTRDPRFSDPWFRTPPHSAGLASRNVRRNASPLTTGLVPKRPELPP